MILSDICCDCGNKSEYAVILLLALRVIFSVTWVIFLQIHVSLYKQAYCLMSELWTEECLP